MKRAVAGVGHLSHARREVLRSLLAVEVHDGVHHEDALPANGQGPEVCQPLGHQAPAAARDVVTRRKSVVCRRKVGLTSGTYMPHVIRRENETEEI